MAGKQFKGTSDVFLLSPQDSYGDSDGVERSCGK